MHDSKDWRQVEVLIFNEMNDPVGSFKVKAYKYQNLVNYVIRAGFRSGQLNSPDGKTMDLLQPATRDQLFYYMHPGQLSTVKIKVNDEDQLVEIPYSSSMSIQDAKNYLIALHHVRPKLDIYLVTNTINGAIHERLNPVDRFIQHVGDEVPVLWAKESPKCGCAHARLNEKLAM